MSFLDIFLDPMATLHRIPGEGEEKRATGDLAAYWGITVEEAAAAVGAAMRCYPTIPAEQGGAKPREGTMT